MTVSGFKHVGERIGRIDGFDKVTGGAKYAGDFTQDKMLHIAIVRSSEPHAEIIALEPPPLPENAWFFSAADLPDNIIEDIIEDQPVLAADKVRFYGEPIALAAAETRQQALQIARDTQVKYRKLPVIQSPREALQPGAAKLFPTGNLTTEFHHEKGDTAEAFRACDLILEEDFELPVQDHAYLEPDAAFAFPEGDQLVVITATQNVFHDRRMIARALALPLEKVHVKAATVGGGFGGKDGHTVQIFAALVALRTGRPAKIVLSRTEVMTGTYKRHAASIHVKMGFRSDGSILALAGESALDTGAYAGLGPAVLGLFSEHFGGPYVIPNVKLDVSLVYTNKAPAHAMRGFGSPQGAFATENLISRAARQLRLDPIEIRLKNALTRGAVGTLGQTMEHVVGIREALETVRTSELWQPREAESDPTVAYGIAAGYLSCGLGKKIPDTACVKVEAPQKEHYRVRVGLVDIGQGSKTALAAIAADALNVPLDQVELIMGDTENTCDCGSTAGSRSIFIAGNAIVQAVRDFRGQPANAQAVGTGNAVFPESSLTLPVAGFPHAMYTFIAQAVKLRVDPVSGQPQLLDIFAATEAGHVINPLSMDGQIQGGVAMSIGYTLGEDIRYREGIPEHQRFANYILPTAMDIPAIHNLSVDSYEESGPMGAKGAAEVATVVIAPAITSAIESICDVKINRLPIDFEKIVSSINSTPKEKK